MGKLSDRLDIETTPWKPQDESPDVIEGEVLEVSQRHMPGEGSRAGRDVAHFEIRDSDNPAVVWGVLCLHHVLESELVERRHVQPGDLVAIKYLGKPAGKDYVSYRVVHEARGPRTASTAPSGSAAAQAAEEPW